MKIRKLFEEMPGKSLNPDSVTYGFLVDVCFKEGRVDDALWYLEKMMNTAEWAPKIDVGFYNKMFDELVKAGSVGHALEIFWKMGERALRLNSTSYEILVRGLSKEGNLDTGQDLSKEIINF